MKQLDFVDQNRATKQDVLAELQILRRQGLLDLEHVKRAQWYLDRYPIENDPAYAGMLAFEIADRILKRC